MCRLHYRQEPDLGWGDVTLLHWYTDCMKWKR